MTQSKSKPLLILRDGTRLHVGDEIGIAFFDTSIRKEDGKFGEFRWYPSIHFPTLRIKSLSSFVGTVGELIFANKNGAFTPRNPWHKANCIRKWSSNPLVLCNSVLSPSNKYSVDPLCIVKLYEPNLYRMTAEDTSLPYLEQRRLINVADMLQDLKEQKDRARMRLLPSVKV